VPARRRAAKLRRPPEIELTRVVRAALLDEPAGPDWTDSERWQLWVLRSARTRIPMHAARLTYTMRDAWDVHGDQLTREWAKARPGTRPPVWWEFSAPAEADQPDLVEDEPAALRELGVLLPGEAAAAKRNPPRP